jgi:hypothetical protein
MTALLNNSVKMDEMGGTHSTHVSDENCRCKIVVGNLNGREHLEDCDADGRIILKWIFGKLCDYVDWFQMV